MWQQGPFEHCFGRVHGVPDPLHHDCPPMANCRFDGLRGTRAKSGVTGGEPRLASPGTEVGR
jgi:hypothetical protein